MGCKAISLLRPAARADFENACNAVGLGLVTWGGSRRDSKLSFLRELGFFNDSQVEDER